MLFLAAFLGPRCHTTAAAGRPILPRMIVRFIAIGGAAMHNLALALHHQGHTVTGSDDAIHDPSRAA